MLTAETSHNRHTHAAFLCADRADSDDVDEDTGHLHHGLLYNSTYIGLHAYTQDEQTVQPADHGDVCEVYLVQPRDAVTLVPCGQQRVSVSYATRSRMSHLPCCYIEMILRLFLPVLMNDIVKWQY